MKESKSFRISISPSRFKSWSFLTRNVILQFIVYKGYLANMEILSIHAMVVAKDILFLSRDRGRAIVIAGLNSFSTMFQVSYRPS